MVVPFNFSRLPQIYFGIGKFDLLPGMIERIGKRVVLLTGKSSFLSSHSGAALLEKLECNKITCHHVIVDEEPTPEIIDSVTARLKNFHPDVVVGIGGGSVIDAGKAVSAMSGKNMPVIDFIEGVGTKEHPGTKIPYIAVPTTSGTGSEATKNAVITRTGRNGFKKSLRHDNLVPDLAIVDPLLTLSCSPEITAASGMDCFTQLAEAFLSEKACEYTDSLAWEGLKAVEASLIQCYHHGDDQRARSGMSFAALTSGICLANAGLGAVHGFASSIGGMFSIPHGALCGTLMAPANEITVMHLRKNKKNTAALNKYAMLGRLFIKAEGRSDNYYIDRFIDYLNEITVILDLPRLGASGINEKNLSEICRKTEIKNNPAKLSQEELADILRCRL